MGFFLGSTKSFWTLGTSYRPHPPIIKRLKGAWKNLVEESSFFSSSLVYTIIYNKQIKKSPFLTYLWGYPIVKEKELKVEFPIPWLWLDRGSALHRNVHIGGGEVEPVGFYQSITEDKSFWYYEHFNFIMLESLGTQILSFFSVIKWIY